MLNDLLVEELGVKGGAVTNYKASTFMGTKLENVELIVDFSDQELMSLINKVECEHKNRIYFTVNVSLFTKERV